jgi:hypothetical protein
MNLRLNDTAGSDETITMVFLNTHAMLRIMLSRTEPVFFHTHHLNLFFQLKYGVKALFASVRCMYAKSVNILYFCS